MSAILFVFDARWTIWPPSGANITPISCYTVSCGRVQNVQFQWKYLLFKLFCSYSLTWSLAVTCSISILLWVFCSCAYSFYRSNRVGFILNLSLLRRKIILVRWVTLQSQSLSFSGYFPFFLLLFCHTTFCTEITNLIGVCVRFRLQLFAILNFYFSEFGFDFSTSRYILHKQFSFILFVCHKKLRELHMASWRLIFPPIWMLVSQVFI